MKNLIKIITYSVILIFVTYSCGPDNNPKTKKASQVDTTFKYLDNNNMALGNPSKALTNIDSSSNYLMVKHQYCLSYNNSKHIPNWVSWHLTTTDIPKLKRIDDFRRDSLLPASWYHVDSTDYEGSGFDRGHMCPSADRTDSRADNWMTYVMSNMIPQAPNNNEHTWEQLEEYERSLVKAGNEVYIICGPYGQGGIGKKGYADKLNHDIVVPAKTWKIIVVLPEGDTDIQRIDTSTRIIAVLMPNDQICSQKKWYEYRVSVDSIESLTGYDFLSNVSKEIQNIIEAKIDKASIKLLDNN